MKVNDHYKFSEKLYASFICPGCKNTEFIHVDAITRIRENDEFFVTCYYCEKETQIKLHFEFTATIVK
jgi:RNase P subunit RPR2